MRSRMHPALRGFTGERHASEELVSRQRSNQGHTDEMRPGDLRPGDVRLGDVRLGDVRLGVAWLVRVRYGAVALFALTLLVCRFALGLEVDYAWIGALLGLTLLTNVVLSRQE